MAVINTRRSTRLANKAKDAQVLPSSSDSKNKQPVKSTRSRAQSNKKKSDGSDITTQGAEESSELLIKNKRVTRSSIKPKTFHVVQLSTEDDEDDDVEVDKALPSNTIELEESHTEQSEIGLLQSPVVVNKAKRVTRSATKPEVVVSRIISISTEDEEEEEEEFKTDSLEDSDDDFYPTTFNSTRSGSGRLPHRKVRRVDNSFETDDEDEDEVPLMVLSNRRANRANGHSNETDGENEDEVPLMVLSNRRANQANNRRGRTNSSSSRRRRRGAAEAGNEQYRAPASEEDIDLSDTERPRRTRRRGGRSNRLRGPEVVGSRSYYRRRPTEDPEVLDIHPEIGTIWDKMDAIPLIETAEADQPEDLLIKLLPFQREGLNWMKQQEHSEFGGGLLADEMGMGKTIQMISLLLSEPRGRPNLIVAPTVALMQWHAEVTNRTKSLSVLIYHGQDRTTNELEFSNYDIILTTYNLIESGFRKEQYGFKRKGELVKQRSALHNTQWFRVVLDEAHYIKDRSCSTARSVFALQASRKWALSGTPLQNRVGELYSLIRFLKADPFSYYFCRKCPCKSLTWSFHGNSICNKCGCSPMNHFCWWNAEILKPIQNFGNLSAGGKAFEKLGKLLDRIMLRRTKIQKADDLGLPPRVVTVRRDVFNEEEEDMYTSLYTDSKRKFSTYVEEGTVLNHYANIFELITKMRLAVNHPDLILKRIPKIKVAESGPPQPSIKKTLTKMSNRLVCAICQDEPEDPIISKCKHVFCREDVKQYIESSLEFQPKCPACFVKLTIDLSQASIGINEEKEDESNLELIKTGHINSTVNSSETFRGSIVNRINLDTWRSSTKIEALVEELDSLRSQDHTIKSIVFSQFVNFLDLVYWRLTRAGFACCRLDGRMSPIQRDTIIKTFMQRHEFTIFLISLKAGGIALNLTEASQVFLCDPWWNPAVEDQAMDRIHRLGQHRPIKVTRLIVENSIESRILQLQAKKYALFQSTIGKDTSALARLTEEDLKFLFVL